MDTRSRRRLVALAVGIPLVLLLVCGSAIKHFLNEFQGAIDKSPKGQPSPSADEAERRGALIQRLTVTPQALAINGDAIRIGDVWLERAAQRVPHLIWSTRYQPLEYYYICLDLPNGVDVVSGKTKMALRFATIKSTYPSNNFVGLPPTLFAARFESIPTFPIEMLILDRDGQFILGRMILKDQ